MPIQGYPFLFPTQKGVQVHGPNAKPFLWVRVTNPESGRAVIALALIDTGAEECAFPSDMAWRLGHELQAGKPKVIHTAGRKTTAFSHTSQIEVLGVNPDGSSDTERVLYTLNDKLIDYTCGLGAFLLGQRNFLGPFVLKIDYPNQTLSVRFPQRTRKKKKKHKHA